MIEVEHKEIDEEVAGHCDIFWGKIEPFFKDVNVQGILLAGAHAKGTVNRDSDIDLNVYYSYNTEDLIKIHPPTINIKKTRRIEVKGGSGTAFYVMDGKEYELVFIPIKTTTDTRKELFSNIYSQKIDYIYKILNGIPYIETKWFAKLLDYLKNDFHLNKDSVFGYFHGYMKSQLQRHRRRVDGERRMLESLKKNSCTPVVKLTIGGVWICLNGLYLLERQKISRNFYHLCFEEYGDRFDTEEFEFLMQCYNHKCNIEKVKVNPDSFIYYAADMRDRIFEKLDKDIKIALDESKIPEFTRSMRKENEKNLNALLSSLYFNKKYEY